jgi:TaqI-like C-terminal specificity domain
MEKIRRAGVPLGEYAEVKPFRGLVTGCNDAFQIETPTRDRLVREDPRSAELIRPFLQGLDVERWSPAWDGGWMIVIPSSENHLWPWTGAPEVRAEQIFEQEYPAVYRHFKPHEAKLRTREDRGKYWWELRSCGYYDAFDQPKILYSDLAWSSQFSLDTDGRFCNNSVYFLPVASEWVLAVLNSPVLWYLSWKSAVHGKDEVLRFFTEFIETLPIPQLPAGREEEVHVLTRGAVENTRQGQALRGEFLGWLRSEFAIASPGKRLTAFAELGMDAFTAEVKLRRPRGTGRLGPGDYTLLADTHQEYVGRIHTLGHEVAAAERRLADIVNEAYGLTQADLDVLWRTAPPRMPGCPRAVARGSKAA